MSRIPLIRSQGDYYSIQGRADGESNFYVQPEEMWDFSLRELRLLQLEYDLRIPVFLLLRNRFHLVLRTPDEPIEKIMYFLMKNLTRRLQKRTGRINKIFGGRYKGCLIEHHGHFHLVCKYILRRPVFESYTGRAEDFMFSTLYYTHRQLPIRLNCEGPGLSLDWINKGFEGEDENRIRYGLTKTVFRLKKK